MRILGMAVLLALSSQAMGAQKFDAALGAVMTNGARTGVPLMAKAAQQDKVPVLIRVEGEDLSFLQAQGVEIRSRLGNIVSANVPLSGINNVLAEDRVLYVEAERPMIGRLNFSVPATRANLIRQGTAPNFTGATGAGVIVGIVDDGLDFRHLDFRNPDGSTRLLGLWDQRVAGAAGAPPAGFGYGGECTPAMLNDAIGGNNAACTQPSTGNHGTHVGGIAAGNGQQTGNGQAAYRFIGMAPLADILAANSIAGGTGGNAVVDAIAWMKARAQSLGKPVVINLSLGSYFGARDGTSNFEQALSNAGAAGVVLVAAAGNEGNAPIRAETTLSQGETKTINFNWGANVTTGQRMEIWYPGSNQYAVRVNGPGGCTTGFHVAGGTNTYNLGCGTLEINSTGPQASNDDRQILISFTPANPVANSQGAWTIEVRGDTVAQANTPLSLICGEDAGGLQFTSNTTPVTTQILTDTSSATRTIAVAAYNTNYTWNKLGGGSFTAGGAGQIGDVSDFSSRGPRRLCSNLTKCPPVQKPEITSPGALIMSALGQDAPVPQDGTTEADGKHVGYNGTSMATPHVAGAVALMLQKNKNLTPEQVKGILFANVQTNAFSTGLPNNAWGIGILNAEAAVLATPFAGKEPSDLNGDQRADLLWRNGGDGSVQGWLMNGVAANQVAGLLPAGNYTVTHVADLDGNGKADTLIQHTDGTVIGWLHDGLNVVGQATFFAAGSGWSIKHAADLNGDGKADLIVENTNGTVVGWLMNGLTVTAVATFVPAGTGWSVSRTGDLNGDGKDDLIWQNTNGTVQAWLMDGLTATQTATYVGPGTGWGVKLVGDFNGDNRADLVWQNTDGTVQAWLMNGLAITQIASFVPAGTGWSPVLAGDIDGDGKADLFWEHTDGRSQTWLMNGLSVSNLAGFVGAGGWRATHLKDLNGDGKKDVLWKHTDGTVQAWLMNGLTITQIASLASAGAYEVIPPRPQN